MKHRCSVDGTEDCRALTILESGDKSGSKDEHRSDDAEPEVDPDCEVEDGCSWSLRIAVAIVLTFCGVWLFSCLHPFVRLILEAEGWRFWLALFMFLVPATMILLCLLYVVWGYFHLPKIIKYSEKAYRDKGRETKLALLLSKRYIGRIRCSMNAYKSLVGDDAAGEFDKLRKMAVEDSPAWLEQFKSYQKALDKQAGREISKFSTRIGATAVVSQMRATDMIAVIVLSAMMLLKLARIYNQRLSTVSALRLALRWGANVYVAGETQEFSKKIAKGTLKIVGKMADLAGKVLPVPAAPLAGSGTAKACDMISDAVGLGAEFAINKILAKKLGTFARTQLHALDC